MASPPAPAPAPAPATAADDRLRGRQRRVRRYSRIVRWMKVALPVGAVLLIGMIFLVGRERAAVFDAGSVAQIAAVSTGMRLDKPRFSGVTEDGDPFIVTADWALPDGAMPDRIQLEKPIGKLQMKDQSVSVTAATGALLRKSERLHLSGDVQLETSDGYRVRTPSVDIDMAAKTAEAPERVHAEGPRGGIDADRVRVVRGEGEDNVTVRFEGNVRVTWRPQQRGDQPSGDGADRQ
jgi:lipopolysaccharide export system protein LptC